jgi:hypothetical protein
VATVQGHAQDGGKNNESRVATRAPSRTVVFSE